MASQEIELKLLLPAVIAASLASACDDAGKPPPSPMETKAERDEDFVRMATAGRMLSDLRTYLRSDDPAPKAFTFDRLDFEPGTSRMRPVDQATIPILAAILEDHPNVRVRVVGFSDEKRASAESQPLSWNRAKAIVLALREAGVASSRLEATAGRGGSRQGAPQLIVLQK